LEIFDETASPADASFHIGTQSLLTL